MLLETSNEIGRFTLGRNPPLLARRSQLMETQAAPVGLGLFDFPIFLVLHDPECVHVVDLDGFLPRYLDPKDIRTLLTMHPSALGHIRPNVDYREHLALVLAFAAPPQSA